MHLLYFSLFFQNQFFFSEFLFLHIRNQFVYVPTSLYWRATIVLNGLLIFGIISFLLLISLLFFYIKALKDFKTVNIDNQQLKKNIHRLRKEYKELQEESKSKNGFISNMSHEIRTPLNAILGLCELLNSKSTDSEKEEYFFMMKESSKDLLTLVNDVVTAERIRSGNEKLSEDYFKPCEIFDNLITFHEPKIKAKNLKIETYYNECYNNTVIGDRAKFEQISLNLVNNAIKFTKHGSIYMACKEQVIQDSRVSITIVVRDSGIGIAAADQTVIFDRFTQLDTGLCKKHQGSGLGLYITNEFVKLMGGNITVTSEIGKGSEFTATLELPLISNEEKIIDEALTKNIIALNLKVLIVDDKNLNIFILNKLLKNMGMNPDFALSGEEALMKSAEANYDIIFMDVHMPEMNGYETTRRIRMCDQEVLILGLSADATVSSVDKGLLSGMNDYLTKPLDTKKLAIIIQNEFISSSSRKNSNESVSQNVH